jgi:hypothetical protein
LIFVQKDSGVYEAEIKADEMGSYFIAAQATRTTGKGATEVLSVRSSATVSYSREFEVQGCDTGHLERLRELTGGRSYVEGDETLAEVAKSGVLFRPVPTTDEGRLPLWYWLVFVTGVLLFFDVATRRLAVDVTAVRRAAMRTWARLRGLPVPEGPEKQEYFDRLQTRKASVSAGLAVPRAARRFEGGPVSEGAAPPGADATAPLPPPGTAPRPAPGPQPAPAQPEPDAGDFASRLARAKKKVQEDLNKNRPRE